MATPKVKMVLTTTDLSTAFGIPVDTEIISVYVTNDPISVTLILMSETEFDELYAPFGGFEPSIGYQIVPKDFFTNPPA